MSLRAAVALGSNLGERERHLRRAVAALGRLGTLEAVSSVYETAPVGGPRQGRFLNAVAVVRTDLDPEALLDELQAIEKHLGRTRTERWGPRTLDLDLVALAHQGTGVTVDTPRLQVPHPRASERRFVLAPLADVWPEAEVGRGMTAAEALEAVANQEVTPTDAVITHSPVASLALVATQGLILLGFALVVLRSGRWPRRVDGSALTGGLVVACGLGLVSWATATLGRDLTPMPAPREGAGLVDTGPFAWMRHPIYSGIVLILGGTSIASRSRASALLLAPVAGFLWAKARHEERLCAVRLPGYRAYLERVTGRLVPRRG